jgi:gliding motility-associated-like protein
MDLCNCDFDGDGLNDIAVTNQVDAASPTVNIYHNTTPNDNLEPVFNRIYDTDMITGKAVRNLACGDLDGDGKPDIVAGKGGNTADRLYIFKNVSTPGAINFEKPETLMISSGTSSSSARRIKIADIDRDGKPEIIMSDQNLGQIHVFRNLGIENDVLFSPAEKTIIESPINRPTLGLEVSDFNSDGKPEIVFSSNLEAGLFIAVNISSIGRIEFDIATELNVGSKLAGLMTADLDLDGDYDIIANDWGMKQTLILVNNGTINNPSFTNPIEINLPSNPWGMDLGDINGDGLPDLAVAIRPEGQTQEKIVFVLNKFSNGSWAHELYNVGGINHYINLEVSDFNGDAKPDIAYISDEGYAGIIRNTHCMRPEIAPSNPPILCNNQSYRLWTSWAPKAQYKWTNGTGDVLPSDERSLLVNESNSYQVRIISVEDQCNIISSAVNISASTNDVPLPPQIQSRHIFCEEDPIKVVVDNSLNPSGIQYHWILPDGGRKIGESIEFAAASIEHTGQYKVVAVSQDGCLSAPTSTTIEVNQLPVAEITASSAPYFCAGSQLTLLANEVANAGYQWQESGNIIDITAVSQISISTGGSYTVIIGDEFGCKSESEPIVLQAVTKPQSLFSSLETACIGDPIKYYNQSTGDPNVEMVYEWDFGDDVFSNESEPNHSYPTGGIYYPSLKVYYENVENCYDVSGYAIEISEAPDLRFIVDGAFVDGSEMNLCAGDTIELWVNTSAADLLWSTGATDPGILISQAGVYSVSANQTGACPQSNEITLFEAPGIDLILEAEQDIIEEGASTRLYASGAIYYEWSPKASLDDPLISDPLASPSSTTTYQVIGSNEFGCSDTDTITISTEVFVEPQREVQTAGIFTPNGDGKNDFWIIQNIEDFAGCPIKIINRAGLTVFESSTYNNNWDGSYNGLEAPEGAYYYVMQCNQNQHISGSITLLR